MVDDGDTVCETPIGNIREPDPFENGGQFFRQGKHTDGFGKTGIGLSGSDDESSQQRHKVE